MKKWNNAEFVTLDINMTASGGNPCKTEKWNEKKERWQGAGHEGSLDGGDNHSAGQTDPSTIIDGTRGDVSTDLLS